MKDYLDDREPADLTLAELQSIKANNDGEGIYFADGELYLTTLSISGGVSDRAEITLSIPIVNFQGGFGDALIQEFHDRYGFSQTGRDGVHQDSYTIYVRDSGGHEVYRRRDPSGGLADIIAGVKVALPAPPLWHVAAEINIKLPTGEEESLYSSGSADLGFQLHTSRRFKRSLIHASGGVLRLGESETFQIDPQFLLNGMMAWECVFPSRWSLITQVTASESPFDSLDIQKLDDVAFLIDIGFKKAFQNKMTLFGAFTENFVNFGSSLDVGLHVGWSWTF